MLAQPAPHHRQPTTWILIADGKQAQIYNCIRHLEKKALSGANPHHLYSEKTGHELIPVEHGALKAESIHQYDIGHDMRGISSSSNSPTHNTYTPNSNIHTELKQRFALSIAEKLLRAHQHKLFDQIILVAPPKMIGELREHFVGHLKDNITAELPKELTHYKGAELIAHLHDVLQEAHI